MQSFLDQHEANILGVLTGFDRVVFRGTLRNLSYVQGMEKFLGFHKIRFGQFGQFAERTTKRIKLHAREFAELHGRPYTYLPSPKISKEEQAILIRDRDGIEEGLVCVFGCSEPCLSYEYTPSKQRRGPWLAKKQRQCLYVYFYFMDREFGLIYVRLQTWLPMDLQVGFNARQYLARRLDRAGIGYEKRDNCFTRIDDVPRAQKMLDALLTRQWSRWLNRLARQINPHLGRGQLLAEASYYWTFRETETATDVMFRDAASLAAIYPSLVLRRPPASYSTRSASGDVGRADRIGACVRSIRWRPACLRRSSRASTTCRASATRTSEPRYTVNRVTTKLASERRVE